MIQSDIKPVFKVLNPSQGPQSHYLDQMKYYETLKGEKKLSRSI